MNLMWLLKTFENKKLMAMYSSALNMDGIFRRIGKAIE